MDASDILTAPVLLATLAFFASMLAMYVFVLRFGPKRGNWNSPAAAFRPPGTRVRALFYGVATVHVALGVAWAIGGSGSRIAVLVASLVMAAFYVAFAQATRFARVSPRPPAAAVSRRSAH